MFPYLVFKVRHSIHEMLHFKLLSDPRSSWHIKAEGEIWTNLVTPLIVIHRVASNIRVRKEQKQKRGTLVVPDALGRDRVRIDAFVKIERNTLKEGDSSQSINMSVFVKKIQKPYGLQTLVSFSGCGDTLVSVWGAAGGSRCSIVNCHMRESCSFVPEFHALH